jgi:hypothetical protein
MSSTSTNNNIISTIDQSTSLSDQITQYVLWNKPKLFILTPCYGGMCHLNYLCALIKTIDIFKTYHFPVQLEFCRNDSLVSRARNNLVAKAMLDPGMTHILFIDSDITWDAMDIFKLILSNKPLIGGVYPLKSYFWDKIIPSTSENKPLDKLLEKRSQSSILNRLYSEENFIKQNLLKYNVNYIQSNLAIDNNIAEVKHIATGFMMIQRNTLQIMMQHYSDTKYTDDVSFLSENENQFAYALFDCRVEDNHYLSEDWLFCNRWANIGGKIYIDVSIDLIHTGQEDYKGSYISTIL